MKYAAIQLSGDDAKKFAKAIERLSELSGMNIKYSQAIRIFILLMGVTPTEKIQLIVNEKRKWFK